MGFRQGIVVHGPRTGKTNCRASAGSGGGLQDGFVVQREPVDSELSAGLIAASYLSYPRFGASCCGNSPRRSSFNLAT